MSSRIACSRSLRSLPKHLLISMGFLCSASLAFTDKVHAQVSSGTQDEKILIKGRVLGEDDKPLNGVSVQVKGANSGTVTNLNGEYQLSIRSKTPAILVFSYVGLEQQEVPVGNKRELNITLKSSAGLQQEVVVVGYGTQKKQAVTGSVVRADLKTYEKVPVNNIMETLKGTIAGLNVGEANTAGAVPGFSIRGVNNLRGANAPLVVLDGAIYYGSLADIAPSDIESVTVLKDASAAAVYGAQAANGVILVDTKKGTGINGKPKFELNTSYGTTNQLEAARVYDAQGYMQRLYDILRDNGNNITFDQTPNYLQTIEKANYNATPDHRATSANPYEYFNQLGHNFNTTVSVSQRTDKMSYYLSGNYTDQKGVVVKDAFKHYAIRLNLESKVTDWLTLAAKTYYSYRSYPNQGGIYGGNSVTSAYSLSPYASLTDSLGNYILFPQTTTSYVNPFLTIPTSGYNNSGNLQGIFSATVKVPWVRGLSYTVNYSKNYRTSESGSFYGFQTYQGQSSKGTGSSSVGTALSSLVDHIIRYNNTFANVHNVDLTLVNSNTKNTGKSYGLTASGFDNDALGTNYLQAGATQSLSTSAYEDEAIGQMARLTYTYDNKYAITGTIRHDGFSAFSANHKWGNFPSVGVNWNITKENFMKKVSFVNHLDLRASYGTVGNQSIDRYSTLSKIGNSYYVYQGISTPVFTQAVVTPANNDLLWESTTGLNFGLDFSLLRNRLSGSVDGYFTKTNNMAFSRPLPATTGFGSILVNAGEIQNRGIELNLHSLNIETGKFSWSSDAAFSLNRNKITHLLGDVDGDGKEDDMVSSNLFIGRSMGDVYGYQVTGMWQLSDTSKIMKGYKPGYYKILDVNGDGLIKSDSDRVHLGNSNANFRWSFTNTFRYGKLSLLVYLNSIWGGNGWFIAGNTPWTDGYANRGDINHQVYDYWTPSNPNAEFPRPAVKNATVVQASKYYDRSFIRLQKLALSYDASTMAQKYGMKGLAISLAADNLGTYAPHWIGLDAATASGLNDSSIPSLRTITLNLNVSF